MKASKSFITTFAAAGLVGAIGLAYAQHSEENPTYTDAEWNPVQQVVEETQPAQASDVLPVQSVDAQQPTTSEPVPSNSGMSDSQIQAQQAPAPTPTYDSTATPATSATPAPSSDNNAPLTERAPRADRN